MLKKKKIEEKLAKFEGGDPAKLFEKIEYYNSSIDGLSNPFFAPNGFTGNLQKVDPKEKYKNEIGEMKLMGFEDESKIIKSLDMESGNIDRAIDRMIGGEE
jgi:hypothetical protein